MVQSLFLSHDELSSLTTLKHRRWKIERLFAWLGNCLRLVVRYQPMALNSLGFVHLGPLLISLHRAPPTFMR